MEEEIKDQTPEKVETLEKINRLNELADRLEELQRLKRAVSLHAYEITKMKARHEREDKLKRFLLCFFAGVCYGILVTAILES